MDWSRWRSAISSPPSWMILLKSFGVKCMNILNQYL